MKIITMDDKGDLHVTRINPGYYDLPNIEEPILRNFIRIFFNNNQTIEIIENIFIEDKTLDGRIWVKNEIVDCYEIKSLDNIIEHKHLIINGDVYSELFDYQSKKLSKKLSQ